MVSTMQMPRGNWCCSLRTKCFIIGYLNLFVSIVDIGVHLIIVSIVTYGFECDVDKESLRAIDYPWLESVLSIINLGSHGLYPFPFMLTIYKGEMMIPEEPRCYPGMMHLNRIDVIGYLINVIWLKFVISFVASIYKRDPDRMRRFFGLALMKLILEVMFVSYQPGFYRFFTTESYWFLKLMDVCITALFLLIINKYIIQLRNERAEKTRDQPPPYIECLINGPVSRVDEKKDLTLNIEEKKNDEPA